LCERSPDRLLARIEAGSAFRASGATNMNDASSRSHAVLALSLGEAATASRLYLVDLAGSERLQRSGVSGVQLQEAVAINQSLLALSGVAKALVENDGRRRAHIPYRDSALTQLLRNSLGGSARTALVACVSPAADSADETLGTLRFAACATHVQNRTGDVERARQQRLDQEQLEDALQGRQVAFRDGWAVIPTPAGDVHCRGGGNDSRDAPYVVLIHLYGSHFDSSMWADYFEPLCAAGYRYLAPDMPGHGRSPGRVSSSPDEFDAECGATDIVFALLDACGVRHAVVMGYDWGGGVACAVAARQPGRVSKLVAWCASVRSPDGLRAFQKQAKKGSALVLWAKNDQWHSSKKGQEIAAALGVKVTEVRLRGKGGHDDARERLLELLAR